jgi:hypothetical protein
MSFPLEPKLLQKKRTGPSEITTEPVAHIGPNQVDSHQQVEQKARHAFI